MELPTKENVVKTPREETRKATIKSVEKTTWAEHLDNDAEKLAKFDNPEQTILVVNYETETGMHGEDAFPFYEKPSDKSVMGQFLERYGDFNEGTEIKVWFDKDGYPSLKQLLK